MLLENNINVCEEHKLVNDKEILYWMDNTHIFYYSCENCTKCNNCKKFTEMN